MSTAETKALSPLNCPSLVTQGVSPGLVWPKFDLMLQNILLNLVVGNEQNCKIRVDFLGNLKFGDVRRPVGENQIPPWSLVSEEREDFRMFRIHRDVGSIRLYSSV